MNKARALNAKIHLKNLEQPRTLGQVEYLLGKIKISA